MRPEEHGEEHMTYEEVIKATYETVVSGFEAQGWKQSRRSNGQCAMRGEEGRACAVGHLLEDGVVPDLNQFTTIEDALAYQPVRQRQQRVEILKKPFRSWYRDANYLERERWLAFVGELQSIHDMAISPEDLRVRIQFVRYTQGIADEPA